MMGIHRAGPGTLSGKSTAIKARRSVESNGLHVEKSSPVYWVRVPIRI